MNIVDLFSFHTQYWIPLVEFKCIYQLKNIDKTTYDIIIVCTPSSCFIKLEFKLNSYGIFIGVDLWISLLLTLNILMIMLGFHIIYPWSLRLMNVWTFLLGLDDILDYRMLGYHALNVNIIYFSRAWYNKGFL